jgi:hypothetical protein
MPPNTNNPVVPDRTIAKMGMSEGMCLLPVTVSLHVVPITIHSSMRTANHNMADNLLLAEYRRFLEARKKAEEMRRAAEARQYIAWTQQRTA